MNSLVFLTVHLDVLSGDRILAKNFANWYDYVLMLEIIGRIGRSLTTLSIFNLCILAVP